MRFTRSGIDRIDGDVVFTAGKHATPVELAAGACAIGNINKASIGMQMQGAGLLRAMIVLQIRQRALGVTRRSAQHLVGKIVHLQLILPLE